MRLIIYCIFCFYGCFLFAQEKREVERRVNRGDVPAMAKGFIEEAYNTKSKLRWYYQTEGDEISFEAKLYWKDELHSVEFDTLGEIKDLEIVVEWEMIDSPARQNLETYFNGHYDKWDLDKVQIQWSGARENLKELIKTNQQSGLTKRYEIEYRGATETEDELWEGLFNADGTVLLQKRKIILGNLNNLTY
tara:strand:- start:3457 stop:4029 length:573 start_codon:yes stop_codon:yes gene_type:complete